MLLSSVVTIRRASGDQAAVRTSPVCFSTASSSPEAVSHTRAV